MVARRHLALPCARFASLLYAAFLPLMTAAAEPAPFDEATERAVRAAIETPSILQSMNFTGKPQFDVTADGRTVVYAVEVPDIEKNLFTVTLWLRQLGSTAEPRRLLEVRSAAQSMPVNPSFSPDGKRLAITGFGEPGTPAIIDVASGAATPVKPDFSKVADAPVVAMIRDVEWAPSGNRIALQVVPPPAPPPARVGVSVTPEWNGATFSDKADRLIVIDADTQAVLAMSRPDVDVTGGSGAFDWSPDGTQLVFSARPVGSNTFDGKWTDLFLLDASGATRDLVRDPGLDIDPRWSPDGRYIGYLSEGGEFSWASRRLARVLEVANGERRTLPQSPGHPTTAYSIAWSGGDILYSGMRGMTCPIIAVSVARNSARQLSPIDLSCYGVTRTTRSGMVLATRQSYETPGDLVMTRPRNWKPVSVSQLVSPPGLPKAQVRSIDWQSQDGQFRIPGILIVPDDGKAGRRPLLVSIGGGPSMIMPTVYNAQAQHLIYPALLRGYAVLMPNTRGRAGFGPAFQQALVNEKNFLGGPLGDVLSGVKHMTDIGLVDSERVAAAGFSYGGALTLYASAHTMEFDAILSAEGVADLLGRAAQNGNFMATERQRAIFGVADIYDPVEQDILAELSPLKYASRVKTPLLIECGVTSLANQDCVRYFRAVKLTGTPTELIVYPRTGHGVFEPALRYDSARRQVEWIDRYVKP